jgi:putative flippase GtrA
MIIDCLENKLEPILSRYHLGLEPFRFVVTGATSSISGLLTIFVMVDGFHLWPVQGTVAANIVSGVVGFVMHKLWTFRNRSNSWRRQAAGYLGLVLTNLVVSATMMYILNDLLGIWYLLAQVLIILGMMFFNFFVNKLIIFRKKTATS